MYKELFAFLSKRGKIDVCISSLFFTLYGLSSVGMLLTVFSILFKIAAVQYRFAVSSLNFFFVFMSNPIVPFLRACIFRLDFYVMHHFFFA